MCKKHNNVHNTNHMPFKMWKTNGGSYICYLVEIYDEDEKIVAGNYEGNYEENVDENDEECEDVNDDEDIYKNIVMLKYFCDLYNSLIH